jgi:hypothetical protein
MTRISEAQNSLPLSTPTPIAPAAASSPDRSVRSRLDELQGQVEKLNKPPKDFWDKLSAISGLLSGSVVALIGIIVTFKLTERRRRTDEEQKDKEVTVLQVQTVQGFMPQLQSGNDLQIESALLAIDALGNSRLAVELARLYGRGGRSALARIASNADQKSAQRARGILDRMFTVSLRLVAPDLKDLVFSLDAIPTFGDLTTQVFWGLKDTVYAFTYETEWLLCDSATGKQFLKLRNEKGEKAKKDTRSLEQAGITPGMTLQAVRLPAKLPDS